MSKRWMETVLMALWVVMMLSACGATTPSLPTALPTPAPTWTPTVTPALPSSSPDAPSVTVQSALASPITAAPPTQAAAPSPPPATMRRIDAAGPAAIPTIAPLPSGQGRSPVRLIIPALNMDVAVQPMGWRVVGDHTEWAVPDNAAGHHIDSAFPGERGNVVLSAHHNIGGAVFAPLSRIGEPGVPLTLNDPMIVEDALGRRFVYRVTGWRRIPEAHASVAEREENASYLLPTDFPQLTLITCWPPESNTHRVIVTGALTDMHTP